MKFWSCPNPTQRWIRISGELYTSTSIFLSMNLSICLGFFLSRFGYSTALAGLGSSCQRFSDVYYLHFTSDGKPWSRSRVIDLQAIYLNGYPPAVAKMFVRWFKMAKVACPKTFNELIE